MTRTIRALTAALAALLIAAPAGVARPVDSAYRASSTAATSPPPRQDLRIPDSLDAARAKTPSDLTAASAQERYYSSYGEPAPLSPSSGTARVDNGDGIAWLPLVLAVFGALIVGLGAGSGLHLIHARRRQVTARTRQWDSAPDWGGGG
jgi:hypothetical protein